MSDEPAVPRRGGRRLDESRNAVILDAALDVLAETGYEGMTIDLVAARAGAARATVYRRWPTKLDLVLSALRTLAPDPPESTRLPDTGSLRGDLLATAQPDTEDQARRRVRVVSGLQAASAREPRLSAALESAGTGPWIEAVRILIRRAIDRGEFAGDRVDVDALAEVVPLMCTARVAIQALPITHAYVVGLIDGVLLPVLRAPASGAPSRREQHEP